MSDDCMECAPHESIVQLNLNLKSKYKTYIKLYQLTFIQIDRRVAKFQRTKFEGEGSNEGFYSITVWVVTSLTFCDPQ